MVGGHPKIILRANLVGCPLYWKLILKYICYHHWKTDASPSNRLCCQRRTLLTSRLQLALPSIGGPAYQTVKKTELFVFRSSLLSVERNCHIFYQVQCFIK